MAVFREPQQAKIGQKWSITVDKTENDSMFWRGVFLKQHGTVSEQT